MNQDHSQHIGITPLKTLWVGLASALIIFGCGREQAPQGPRYTDKAATDSAVKHYVFAIHPLHNPQLLHQKFEPLMRYLSAHIPGTQFEVDASNTYADYEAKLRNKTPDFSLPSPYHGMLSRDWGYHIIAKMGNDEVFRGIFLARNESPIKVPTDLKGKTVAYPAPTALAAAMMPQLYLQTHGVDVETELNNQYVGTHNSSIMNAYLGQSAVSATWPVAWEAFKVANPKEASELKVLWETPKLIQNAVIARNDVPKETADKVVELLTGLHRTDEGRTLLANIDTTSFEASDDRQFDVVGQFVKEFNAKVKKTAQ